MSEPEGQRTSIEHRTLNQAGYRFGSSAVRMLRTKMGTNSSASRANGSTNRRAKQGHALDQPQPAMRLAQLRWSASGASPQVTEYRLLPQLTSEQCRGTTGAAGQPHRSEPGYRQSSGLFTPLPPWRRTWV